MTGRAHESRAGSGLAARAAEALRSLAGIRDYDKVVAAVSGGADSVAMLLMLVEASEKGLLRLGLTVAHLHHGIRGATADQDLEFVRELAGELKLPFAQGRADVPAISAEGGQGIEAAARMARYDFLANVARGCGAVAVATGHTLDDQAETVLHRIVRGAGSRGLAGIIPCRPICTDPSILLVRPMLEVTRAAVVAFLADRGQRYRTDETNLDLRYTRNRVRLEAMPVLEGINPGVKAHLAALASEFGLRRETAPEEPDPGLKAPGALVPADGATSERLANAARAAYQAAGGDPASLERRHFKALAELLADHEGHGSTINLPRGFSAVRTGGLVVLTRRAVPRPTGIARAGLPLGGLAEAEGLEINASLPFESSAALTRQGDGMTEIVDFDRLKLPLSVRARAEGDRFHPLGAPGSTRLKEFMRASGIPPGRRDSVPLVVDASDRIIWVVPYRIAEQVKADGSTRKVVELKAIARGSRISGS